MLLEVKNLKVEFKGSGEITKAVNGIDFSVEENEVLGIAGESGSGKTVTALSLLRLLPRGQAAISGEILFFPGGEKNILALEEKRMLKIRGKEIAMIFQEPFTSLNPVLRVGEQVAETMLAHEDMRPSEARKKTLTLLEKVKIRDPERIYESYPHLISGGQRQRIMIAMAVALRPKLLVADEPTTALDVTVQAEILELLLRLKEELGMSVLFITHDFGIIKRISDRVIVMKEGRVVESGKKSDVLSSPGDAYTKKLIEAVPVIGRGPGGERPFSEKNLHKKTCPHPTGLIEVRGLNKAFAVEKGLTRRKKGTVRAVNNVSLALEEGRTLGIVGESGSGKTTLARLLVGLLEGDSGEISSKAKNIQIVFQDPFSSLDPRMKMGDIVLEGPFVRGVPAKERKALLNDLLFKVYLNYRDRAKYPHQFSGGQRQRIAIARALAVRPRVVILDEPVSSLDVVIQKEVLELLKKLQAELGLTYVFISHDLRVVYRMADDIAVMQDGKIVESGPREKIYASPAHPYTRKLLASVLT